MKKIIQFSWAHALIGIALCTFLFSFSTIIGAHSVQVYLDSKLVIDHYVNLKADVPSLLLDPADNQNNLIVKYSECGRTVTSRTITVKDDKNNVLKGWRFEGETAGFKDPMTCPIKDIVALKQKESNTLKLFYSSKEFPEGQQIASLVIADGAKTASK